MNIAHTIPSLDPAAGGPPHVVQRLAAAQAASGNKVSILTYRSPQVPGGDRSVPGIANVEIIELRNTSLRDQLFGNVVRAAISRHAANADILHCHGVWEPILRIAATWARKRSIPYVIRPAGMLDPWSLRQKRWKKKLAMLLGYRRMLNHAAFIHALNPDEARLLKPLNLAAPIEIIPNGIFLDEIEPLPDEAAFHDQHPAVGGRPFVLFLSRLHHKKGLDYLAQAFARVAASQPEVQLVVAGPDDGAAQPFRQAIEDAGLTDRVHLLGPLYGRAKYQALAAADCFCLPSRQEGFSVAILEALACRTPVVISQACHFPEVADTGAGHVVPLDPQNIANALSNILSDRDAARQMGHAGRRLVEQNYTWPAIARLTLDAYQRA